MVERPSVGCELTGSGAFATRRNGNLGPHKAVGDGVFELILDFGPGYRVFFGFEGDTMILLLVGGDKSTQRKNIDTAKRYWKEGDHGTTKR